MDCSLQSHKLSVDRHTVRSTFFTVTDAFYLTGGTTLAGYYLADRTSVDLGVFTQWDAAFAQFHAIMRATAAHLRVRAEAVRATPYLKHYTVFMPGGPVTVHSARDLPVRLAPVRDCSGMRSDAIENMTTHKQCAMLGRGAMKGFIDLYSLDQAGFTIERFLEPARQKDGSLEAATRAYAINQRVSDTVVRPVTREPLQAFKKTSVARLLALSFPPSAA